MNDGYREVEITTRVKLPEAMDEPVLSVALALALEGFKDSRVEVLEARAEVLPK